ncbi:hypothetical protein Sme01_02590 [Sphaerisporangium melleum]|uniref:Uncharacterized protein n=1 Tax=Sphaerisporangium melleum TaxID=321316 RepID=A0A917VBC1_9ACTN|nr:hypothetical protein [Sphaerisporangium melleum]GGK60996.1 hypothetical protein GCM10007964_00130 [Sphaerisporangium melleum]GII67783.1 hypothetical protein Sme01_02590 [Sphaerisporangium melleum]
MTGLEAAVVVAVGLGVAAVSRKSGRRSAKATRSGGRTGRVPRKSRLVVMYNSTGARPVEADDAGTAAAEIAGRVLGSTARRSSRRWRAVKTACSRAGKWAARRSRARWEHRQAGRTEQTIVDKWREAWANRPRRGGATPARVRVSLRQVLVLLRLTKPAPAAEQAPADRVRPVSDPIPGPDPPDTPRPRPRPVYDPPNTSGEPAMTAPADTVTDAAPPVEVALPPHWATLVAAVADFDPENDAALMEWMKGEAAGVVAYAQALDSARENCVNDVGLDPSSVQGVTIYSEHMSDASIRMAEALAQFRAVYGEVLALAAAGVVLPHNGRWMTGAASS